MDDPTPELHSIEAPTLILWGDQDALIRRDEQDVLTSAMPTLELVVPRRWDALHWEEPERFAADLVAFVEWSRFAI